MTKLKRKMNFRESAMIPGWDRYNSERYREHARAIRDRSDKRDTAVRGKRA